MTSCLTFSYLGQIDLDLEFQLWPTFRGRGRKIPQNPVNHTQIREQIYHPVLVNILTDSTFLLPVHGAGDHVGHGLGGVVHHAHARDLLLDGAVRVDLGAELGPSGGVGDRLRNDLPHGAGQGGAHPEAAVVQDLQMQWRH